MRYLYARVCPVGIVRRVDLDRLAVFHVLAVKFSARLAPQDPPGVRTWTALLLRATDTRMCSEGCPLRLTVYASAATFFGGRQRRRPAQIYLRDRHPLGEGDTEIRRRGALVVGQDDDTPVVDHRPGQHEIE